MGIYFLCDINNAFLSMQAVYNLQHGAKIDLREIPSVIGGSEKSRHGIVLAKSTVAKSFGIKTAMTLNDARKLCPNLVIVAPSYDVYVKASKAMMNIMRDYSPNVEVYSIDECWIDFTGMDYMYEDYFDLALKIQERVYKEIGITINIGISTNKLLSKMASGLIKPNMVNTLYPKEVEEKLHPLDIGDLFGIGQATSKKLRKYGINTVGDIASSDVEFLTYLLKSYGLILYNYSWGKDVSIVNDVKYTKVKSIGNSRTISYDVDDPSDAFMYIMSLAETVGMRLRNLDLRANLVSVAIKDTEFIVRRKQEKLLFSIASTNDIIKVANRLFLMIWEGKPIRHIEVRVGSLEEPMPRQLNLLENADDVAEQVDIAVDSLRNRFGKNIIIRGALLNTGIRGMSGGTPGDEDATKMRGSL